MNYADIGIIGGGLAGSLTAAMLGRAGISTVLIDVHKTYPEDFRVEKLDQHQLGILKKTGLFDGVLKDGTLFEQLWLIRDDILIDKRPNYQYGIAYADLVKGAREMIPSDVPFVVGRASNIEAGPDRQTIQLASGQTWSVRLIVLATGLNNSTSRQQVGITRHEVSKGHSVAVGFNLEPRGRAKFEFPALTYIGGPKNRIAYLTLFPMRGTMRANLFLYRDIRDPWLHAMRTRPKETMLAAMPKLRQAFGEFDVTGDVLVRPTDLYVTQGYRRPGVVLVGDSFMSACPAGGTGSGKVLMDVERLCNGHIPRWLETEGMGEDKISTFYDDPEKVANDAASSHLAFHLRSLTLDAGIIWKARRVFWFGVQALQGMRRKYFSRILPGSTISTASIMAAKPYDPLF